MKQFTQAHTDSSHLSPESRQNPALLLACLFSLTWPQKYLQSVYLPQDKIKAVWTPCQHTQSGMIDTWQLTWLCRRPAFSSEKIHASGSPASPRCCRTPCQGTGSGPWLYFALHQPTAALTPQGTQLLGRTECICQQNKTESSPKEPEGWSTILGSPSLSS